MRTVLVAVFGLFFIACQPNKTLFEALSSSNTGVDFVNKVEENDQYNVLEYMNIYTGAGVAAGDVNNDGLVDLYFSGNQTSGRLYLNKGGSYIQFEDVTEKAGLITNRWCTGVSMVDINQDGWLDIYVNVSGSAKFGNTANLLYINNQDGTFKESAVQYGIAEKRQTMNATFFDYDRDGDLDLFLITNPADQMVTGVNNITGRKLNGESEGTDILYRNEGNGKFTDVSRQAGILIEGYSLGAAISDFNNDGWPDIYVSNDFLTNDILYINNTDGTFTDKANECFKHTSFASMGNDAADFNNDGFTDIFVLDMLPEDNFRKKMLIPSASYDKFQLALQQGYNPSYTRNTLQLNNGNGRFSEIAYLAGVSSTDWSWSALWADYDNDGYKDLMVTNGFYRDLGDLDYINYQTRSQSPMGTYEAKRKEKLKDIHTLAKVPLQNYLFQNKGDLTFHNASDDWGFTEKGFSNGACYADLDNDGDLELIINDFNGEAKIYQNRSERLLKHTFLNISLEAPVPNRQGIGAKVFVYANQQMQMQELNPYRGYESSVEQTLHFGLGKNTQIDSLVVVWPNGKRQVEQKVSINKSLKITYQPANEVSKKENNVATLFADISNTRGLDFQHEENVFVDFKVQSLMPHLHSKNGPGIAVGDVNGDDLDDFYVGGATGFGGKLFIQQKNGKFEQRIFPDKPASDEMGVLFFDADNDNDLDLYIVGGGSESRDQSPDLQDRLYLNDGSGNFKWVPSALPNTQASGSCVVASDYDHDGDMDLFVGGRVAAGNYPAATRSYLLKNNSVSGSKINAAKKDLISLFTDVTPPELAQVGMVTAALWSDFDNDTWKDLVIVGEFMPMTLFKNKNGRLTLTNGGQRAKTGWWNSLTAGDFDADGDIDYVAGNLGLNSRYRAKPSEPLAIYTKDYDKNGKLDPILTYYVQGQNYISHTRDELAVQVPPMKVRFGNYKDYASATFEKSLTKEELADAKVVKSECFESSYFENLGSGQFKQFTLPMEAQMAPIFGLLTSDYNHDGNLDVLAVGNSYATEVSMGRYDAMTGLLLAGDGHGNFKAVSGHKTGLYADQDAKGMAELQGVKGQKIVLVANNSSYLMAFSSHLSMPSVKWNLDDAYLLIQLKNGKQLRHEFYWGQGYLSQSSVQFVPPSGTESITITNWQGKERTLSY